MKAYERKKQFRLFIKYRVRDGKMNQPDGSWIAAPSNSTSGQHLRAGHRVDRRS